MGFVRFSAKGKKAVKVSLLFQSPEMPTRHEFVGEIIYGINYSHAVNNYFSIFMLITLALRFLINFLLL